MRESTDLAFNYVPASIFSIGKKKNKTKVKVTSNHTVDQAQVDSGTERPSEG